VQILVDILVLGLRRYDRRDGAAGGPTCRVWMGLEIPGQIRAKCVQVGVVVASARGLPGGQPNDIEMGRGRRPLFFLLIPAASKTSDSRPDDRQYRAGYECMDAQVQPWKYYKYTEYLNTEY
jgi:hypothetical protein